jgi:putative transposase
VKGFVKFHLERALVLEQRVSVGCDRYKWSEGRKGYRNGSYVRDLLTTYGWVVGLVVSRLRKGRIESEVLEWYRRRQRRVDLVLLEAFLSAGS